MQSECSVLPDVVESPGDLIAAVWRAVREQDRAAELRRLYRLERCVRRCQWLSPRRFGLPPDEEDDHIQQFLLKVVMLPRRAENLPEKPGAYGKRIAHNLMMDARAAHERRKFREPEEVVEINLEQSGVFSLRSLEEAEQKEQEIKDLAVRIDAYVTAYMARAKKLRGEAARQVLAWYYLRLRKEPARAVATEVGLEPSDATLVQQWAKRGAEKVKRLALEDEDRERAEVMLRAVG